MRSDRFFGYGASNCPGLTDRHLVVAAVPEVR